jgi:hypothetical protein
MARESRTFINQYTAVAIYPSAPVLDHFNQTLFLGYRYRYKDG